MEPLLPCPPDLNFRRSQVDRNGGLGERGASLGFRVCQSDSVVLPDLVDLSLSGSTQAAFPLVVGWSTKRQVDVAVEGLVCRDVLL